MHRSCRRLQRPGDAGVDRKQRVGQEVLEPVAGRAFAPQAQQRHGLHAVGLARRAHRPRGCTVLQGALVVATLDVDLGQAPRRGLGHRGLRRRRAGLGVGGQPRLQCPVGRVAVGQVVLVLVATQQQGPALPGLGALQRGGERLHRAAPRALEQLPRARLVEHVRLRGQRVGGVLEAPRVGEPSRAREPVPPLASPQRRGQRNAERPLGRRLEQREGRLRPARGQRRGDEPQQQPGAKRFRQIARAATERGKRVAAARGVPGDEVEIAGHERVVGGQARRARERLARACGVVRIESDDREVQREHEIVRRQRHRVLQRGLGLGAALLLGQRVGQIHLNMRILRILREGLAQERLGRREVPARERALPAREAAFGAVERKVPPHASPSRFYCRVAAAKEDRMSGFAEYERHDGLGLAALVARREVKPEELLEAAISRVEARNPAVNAVTMKLYDYGRQAIAAGLPDGPFRGVPYLMKDLTASIAGVPMTRSSRYYADTPPPTADSEHVRRLKRAGLVVFGRTNTCELGLSLTCEPQMHGATKNPWDPTRISGGSSGGAAAAVGARMLPMAHATDGFGSIRAPAACCGLVGLKPTRGRNTMAPYTGEGLGGLSAEHAVTLTVRDSAALLDATAGAGPGDPYVAPPLARPLSSEVGADPGRLRIAFTSVAPNGAKVEADSLRTLGETAKLCVDLGHHVEEVKPSIDGEAVVPTFLTLAAANTVVNLGGNPARGRPAREDEVERVTWATGQMGERVSGADYVRATQTAHRLGRQMAAFHQRWNILLTPGLATLPPKLGLIDMMLGDVDEYWRRVFHFSPFTVWFNLTGQPAMMLPLGVAGDLPVAVQLVARYGDEATLFRLAAQLETARPWFDRRPAIAR